MNKFAEKFNQILTERKISQTQISKCLRVKQYTVSQWANGKREPDFDMLIKICMLLGTSPNEMLGFDVITSRCLYGFIRDVIGNDKNFQMEQMGLLESMRELGQSEQMGDADEELFNSYVDAYQSKYGFEL